MELTYINRQINVAYIEVQYMFQCGGFFNSAFKLFPVENENPLCIHSKFLQKFIKKKKD